MPDWLVVTITFQPSSLLAKRTRSKMPGRNSNCSTRPTYPWSRLTTPSRSRNTARVKRASVPMIDIVQPDDVVLAEIAAGLHLDKLQRDLAGIGKTMNRADRYVDRLVLLDHALRVA